MDGYSTDEDGKNFESDRRFSNYIMFIGSFSMVVIFMIANVIQLKKQKESKERTMEPTKSTTKYTGKADIGGSWVLYDTKGEPFSSKDLEGKYYLIYFAVVYFYQ